MGQYSDAKQEYHKSRIRDIMILKPEVSAEAIKAALAQSALDPLNLDRTYIRKLMGKIKKDRIVRIDRADIRERLGIMRETYNLVSEQMWKILLESNDRKAQVSAGKVIVDAQKNLLESEMNAGVFDRKLGTINFEAGGQIEHVHTLSPELKAPILHALEKYGIIRSAITITNNDKLAITTHTDGNPERV